MSSSRHPWQTPLCFTKGRNITGFDRGRRLRQITQKLGATFLGGIDFGDFGGALGGLFVATVILFIVDIITEPRK
jgi:hypothetical protein